MTIRKMMQIFKESESVGVGFDVAKPDFLSALDRAAAFRDFVAQSLLDGRKKHQIPG